MYGKSTKIVDRFLRRFGINSLYVKKFNSRYFTDDLFKIIRQMLGEKSAGRLRCFDTVFQRPYRHFSIVLKVFFSWSDRYKIFTSNWRWIEICKNAVLSKIDVTMTTINKQNEN